ncbi:LOW QUALITY PROTEIN: formimidoyltransferase-cyclodeaminase-like, partial [Menidia menidia]
LQQADWAPDFGPASFVPSWGATVTGARRFLVAFNVNLISTREQAHRLALDIREGGRGPGQPGALRKVQGLGWYLDEAHLAQVSTNILDHEVTPLHCVFEEVRRRARELKLPVVGSQVVGLVPLKALLDSADFYIKRDGLFVLEEEHKIRLVISKLGLDSLGPFKPQERVIEYMVRSEDPGRLASLTLQQFVQSVAARTPAPGGGSVSAAIAALGAALGAMVGQMTYGKRQFERQDAVMRRLIPPFHQAANQLLRMVDADSDAFNHYMAAMKMPKSSAEEIKSREAALQEALRGAVSVPLALTLTLTLTLTQPGGGPAGGPAGGGIGPSGPNPNPNPNPNPAGRRPCRRPCGGRYRSLWPPPPPPSREAALQEALRGAVSVPLALAERVSLLWPPLQELLLTGNPGCRSDAQVAAKALEASVFGACFNIRINLKDVQDRSFREETEKRAAALLQEAKDQAAAILEASEGRG